MKSSQARWDRIHQCDLDKRVHLLSQPPMNALLLLRLALGLAQRTTTNILVEIMRIADECALPADDAHRVVEEGVPRVERRGRGAASEQGTARMADT
jgi:hypothetical protein